jgi:hypothetical protein
MIVIGADTQKRTHALAAVEAATGAVVGQQSITADEPGHLRALRWARDLGEDDRLWALEDCRHVSRRLEQALVAAGERVIRVAPKLMGQARRGERQPATAGADRIGGFGGASSVGPVRAKAGADVAAGGTSVITAEPAAEAMAALRSANSPGNPPPRAQS